MKKIIQTPIIRLSSLYAILRQDKSHIFWGGGMAAGRHNSSFISPSALPTPHMAFTFYLDEEGHKVMRDDMQVTS